MTPTEFIAAMLPGALAAQTQYGIPAGFGIAQAAVETGWLKVVPPGNNLYGIKADPSWHGPTVMEHTHETIHGISHAEYDAFRAYPDYASSIVDHASFLVGNERYKNCFTTTDSAEFAKLVAADGYATGVSYAQTLCDIIAEHDLTQYDVKPNT